MSRPAITESLDKSVLRDFERAAELIGSSWRENRETSMDYTPEYLRSMMSYPGARPTLAPAFYDGDRLVAFVLGFPRTFVIRGETRTLLLMSFFTVAPGYKGKGIGRRIWAECLLDARKAGYHGALHYCVDTNPSNRITAAGANAAGFEARHIFTVRYLMGFLRRDSGQGENRDEPPLQSTQPFLHATEHLASAIPLKRKWNLHEAEWLRDRPGSILTTDPAGAALSGYLLKTADSTKTSCFFIEDILWDGIAAADRPALLSRCLARAAESATIVTVPILNYADMAAFAAAGFRRSPRVLNTYLTLWDGSAEASEMPSLYTDVL